MPNLGIPRRNETFAFKDNNYTLVYSLDKKYIPRIALDSELFYNTLRCAKLFYGNPIRISPPEISLRGEKCR